MKLSFLTPSDFDVIKLSPFIKEFIKYYYQDLGNGTGGYLHICLDDGNLEPDNIQFCKHECINNGDSFGYFLCELLDCFTQQELEDMYEDNHFGMK